MLTFASREALARRVNEGCGLILIRPSGQLSPLTPTDLKIATESEFVEQQQERQTEASPWTRIGDRYIARAIPVETFPFGDLQNYIYRAAPDATVLIRTESGNPVLAVRQSGQGRVVAFGYELADADVGAWALRRHFLGIFLLAAGARHHLCRRS